MKNKISLVIMAAGIGSRYGGGIKQLAAAGPSGEILMDYSIYDALKAGFEKIVFVIRHRKRFPRDNRCKDRVRMRNRICFSGN